MKQKLMIGAGAVVLLGLAAMLAITSPCGTCSLKAERTGPAPAAQSAPDVQRKLPLLLELGSTRCIPCRMMEPVLDQLSKEYSKAFEVKFVDVWLKENVAVARKHNVQAIPTQIFLDPNGKELWRHVGFMPKEDILAKWKELGYSVQISERIPEETNF